MNSPSLWTPKVITSVAALIGVLWAAYQFRQQRREATLREGQQTEKTTQLAKDLAKAEASIVALQVKAACNDVDMAGFKAALDYLVKTVGEIKEFMNQVAPPTISGERKKE